MTDYPEGVYGWVFNYDEVEYKLRCKQKMYWKTYKFKATDVQLVDKSTDKEMKQTIADSLNEELR